MSHSRRDLLKYFGGGAFVFTTCPISELLALMVEGIIAQAQAQTASSSVPRTLIHLNLEGGIQRWNWDNPLRPRGTTDSFYDNPMIVCWSVSLFLCNN